MIDQRHRNEAPRLGLRLPVPAAAARALVLAAVFVCAACGLVYELELVALASYLVGDSVTQASVILSVMVFAMGCGSLLAKRLRGRAAAAFAAVETGLALVGGLSVMVLYGFFAWFGQATAAMVGCAFAIGVLTGAEVPLLMTLVQRIRQQDAGGAVADLFAADYVGALVGGLAFPFLLLPHFGQLTGALATGVVNAAAGGATVLWLFRGDLSRRARGWLLVANVLVLAVLAGAGAAAGPFERAARHAVYGGDVRVAEQTSVQEIVLTGGDGAGGGPLRLYLDGRLRVSGSATARYAQALVHPAMNGPHARVLVLGGGDGLALREVLRYKDVAALTAVQPDGELLRLGRTDPGLRALNGDAYADPRVRAVTADPFDWLRGPHREAAGPYDVIVADLADPGISRSAKLYSQEFYGLAARALAPGGRLAVRAGTAAGAARTFWTIDATVRAVGLQTSPYWLPATPSGAAGPAGSPDQAYLLAARGAAPPLALPPGTPPTLTPPALRLAARAPLPTRPSRSLPPSTLLRPRIPAS
ncbi:polyamine aminopropyltransferase [Actinacidiphila paucisporea]|uniref:Polyamine aminopropyltransferase n=1 Tax=Actinacidiphila paucisporea TaxID=310782 RepID=A0A1M7QZB2_9ACTN|nr:polyamine aminopropyltransferase [Actinacidiphila paucisporea]SHN37461.1 spermidine synthase [Actinacidiphila paucisporea]